jgi:hypothetical protein
MFPVFKLVAAHIKPAAIYHCEAHITAAGFKFSIRKTHRLRPVAASTALVEHQGTMEVFQFFYQLCRLIGGDNPCNAHINKLRTNPHLWPKPPVEV